MIGSFKWTCYISYLGCTSIRDIYPSLCPWLTLISIHAHAAVQYNMHKPSSVCDCTWFFPQLGRWSLDSFPIWIHLTNVIGFCYHMSTQEKPNYHQSIPLEIPIAKKAEVSISACKNIFVQTVSTNNWTYCYNKSFSCKYLL